jgi:hypothetical protein
VASVIDIWGNLIGFIIDGQRSVIENQDLKLLIIQLHQFLLSNPDNHQMYRKYASLELNPE